MKTLASTLQKIDGGVELLELKQREWGFSRCLARKWAPPALLFTIQQWFMVKEAPTLAASGFECVTEPAIIANQIQMSCFIELCPRVSQSRSNCVSLIFELFDRAAA